MSDLLAFIKDLSDVDENLQGFYKKAEGGYLLAVQAVGGHSLEDVSGLKSSLTRLKSDNEDLKTSLKAFGDEDPKEVQRKLARYHKIKDLNEEQIKKQVKLDVTEEVENQFKSAIKEKETTIEKLKAGIKKAARGEIYAEIAKAGGEPTFAEPYIRKMTDVEITDDGYRLKILNENGKERFSVIEGGETVPFTAPELVKELQEHEIFGKMFPADGKSGSGGKGKMQSPGQKGVKTITKEQAESGEFIKELAEGSVVVA